MSFILYQVEGYFGKGFPLFNVIFEQWKKVERLTYKILTWTFIDSGMTHGDIDLRWERITNIFWKIWNYNKTLTEQKEPSKEKQRRKSDKTPAMVGSPPLLLLFIITPQEVSHWIDSQPLYFNNIWQSRIRGFTLSEWFVDGKFRHLSCFRKCVRWQLGVFVFT